MCWSAQSSFQIPFSIRSVEPQKRKGFFFFFFFLRFCGSVLLRSSLVIAGRASQEHSASIPAKPHCNFPHQKGEAEWSGGRDLNPRLQRWQRCILPLNYPRKIFVKQKFCPEPLGISHGSEGRNFYAKLPFIFAPRGCLEKILAARDSLPLVITGKLVGKEGFEPPRVSPPAPKAGAYSSSATCPY